MMQEQIIDDAGTHNYSYDTRDRLTAGTHPSQRNESYTLDDVGNRTASHQSSSYTYQPFNRLTAANSDTYAYNLNGNLTSKTDASGSWTYTWDFENRLKQASQSGGVTVTYAYDALGRRIQRTSSTAGTTKFVYDGADVLRDLDGSGNTIADYLNGPGIDNKFRQTSGSTALYFIQDHLGTTRALTDASGNIASSLGYDSYGNVSSGSASTRYTYTGREADSDNGLMYYRARWYDPQQGRFISEDPIGFDGGDVNVYSYVANSPVSKGDPFGLQRAGPRGRGNYKPDFPTRCNRSQDCETIARNMAAIARRIASAQLIDEELGFARHSPPYSTTIPDSQRSFFNCKKIFDEKCKNCGPPGSPVPVPKPADARRPIGPGLEELRMQEESARQMEIFWKKVLFGSIAGGAVLIGGPPAIAALLRALATGGAAAAPAYAH
jgi:RHS repeat-associated protein